MEMSKQVLQKALISMSSAVAHLQAANNALTADMANAEVIASRAKPLPKATAEEQWVTAKGEHTTIGEMHEHHAKNALAKIMRELRDHSKVAYINGNGRITFAPRLRYVVDGQNTFIDDEGMLNNFPQSPDQGDVA